MTKPSVGVFGAGIAGLTAAHELVERGFHVEVYETNPARGLPELSGRPCDVGGMARTQWACVPKGDPPAAPRRAEPLGPRRFDDIPFTPGQRALKREQKTKLDAIKDRLLELELLGLRVRVEGYCAKPGLQLLLNPSAAAAARRPDVRFAALIRDYFVNRLGVQPATIDVLGAGLGRIGDQNASDAERSYVSFHVIEDWIPGEHGFRFFPSFYRNLFDTMKRIPIAQEGWADATVFVETGQTVFDNLMPTATQGFAFAGGRWITMARRPMGSLREALDTARDVLDGFGCGPEDAAHLPRKLFEYLTSCQARRAEYERISWWEFIDGDRFDEPFRRYLDGGPQLLVAMRARRSDARTIGTVAVQLLFDELKVAERTDATLNGPTSSAWFAPWRRYLEKQGVTFWELTLDQLEVSPDNVAADVQSSQTAEQVNFDYVVLAVPPQVAKTIVSASKLDDPDSRRVADMDLGKDDESDPGGSCGHMSGIQLYFATGVNLFQGHVIYPDSPWALSSIAQPQFWTEKRGEWSGYRGLLSVDIGNWAATSPRTGRSAWDSSREEIFREVWRQIKDTLPDPSAVPDPIYYHLDEQLEFGPRDGLPEAVLRNRLPFVINPPGEYAGRPGEYDHGPGEAPRYRVRCGDRLVYAGSWVRTHTRLNTMEAANESARMAVNGILHAEGLRSGAPYEPCAVFDPEEHELEDLRYLVELDERLHAEGLPHFLDILDAERLLDLLVGEGLNMLRRS
jgi:uncharacterized protein with NAD-binding domain and iron-sulfur cluster